MIRTTKEAYRAGFASGFISNSNEILERRKFQFDEVSVREEKKMRDAFHKGYYECQELIRKVNIEKINKENEYYSDYWDLEEKMQIYLGCLINRGYSGFFLF